MTLFHTVCMLNLDFVRSDNDWYKISSLQKFTNISLRKLLLGGVTMYLGNVQVFCNTYIHIIGLRKTVQKSVDFLVWSLRVSGYGKPSPCCAELHSTQLHTGNVPIHWYLVIDTSAVTTCLLSSNGLLYYESRFKIWLNVAQTYYSETPKLGSTNVWV